jgi:phosphoenolpyruvate carboxykinase (ATP)
MRNSHFLTAGKLFFECVCSENESVPQKTFVQYRCRHGVARIGNPSYGYFQVTSTIAGQQWHAAKVWLTRNWKIRYTANIGVRPVLRPCVWVRPQASVQQEEPSRMASASPALVEQGGANRRADAGVDLRVHGLVNTGTIFANLSPAALTEAALARGEGVLSNKGAFAAYTGTHTGRSPKDRYLVAPPPSQAEMWWGPVNRPMQPEIFERLRARVIRYFEGRETFVNDGWACADPRQRLQVRVISDKAWHALFANCLFLRPSASERAGFQPDFTVFHAGDLEADPARDGTRSGVFIVLNLEKRVILIGGTHYAGEIKKSIFSVLNYLMPHRGVFPMHCSANMGASGDTALFFGLSGTGKTTLSADPGRRLIGDDEHGWSDDGVFNFEGGCYAKTINLTQEHEPQIWNAIRFGCVLENVAIDPATREPDFRDTRYTENTRAAYPVDFIDDCELTGQGGHPRCILFLTCDAFGVLPPVSKLTTDQALYHFLSGYTAKIAGTETGITEPQATFSTCFAAPFLPLHPARYAEMLGQRLTQHRAEVWFLNTGWTSGPFGQGHRIPLKYTRAMVQAILNGDLAGVSLSPDPVFKVLVPQACPGVPQALLNPRSTWKNSADYDAKAAQLADLFRNNFKAYASQVTEAVRAASP